MNISIGTKIKSLRLQKKLSQSELCGNFMNRVVLSKIENGKALPSLEQLIYIAEKLKVPVGYFFSDLKDTSCINNAENFSSIIKELFYSENYYDIVKLVEDNYNEFCKIEDFNKYYFAGMAFFHAKLFNKSLKLLRKYVKIFTTSCEEIQKENIDNFGNALNTLFKIMLKNNNLGKGINYLELAKKYLYYFKALNHPISFIIHNNLAYAYLRTCQFQKVVTLLESFINPEPNFIHTNVMPDIYISLNIACYNIEEYEKSIRYIKKAILLFEYMEKYSDAAECYLNYINALRYSGNFEEAFNVLKKAKNSYKDMADVYHKFKIQEMILYFNIGMYEKVVELSESINTSLLSMRGKKNLTFMLGHIKYLNKEFEEAYRFLKKCEKYFAEEKFYHDLYIIYEDLYAITGNVNYRLNALSLKNKLGRKNVII